MTLHIGYKSPFRTNLLPTNLSGNGLFLFLYGIQKAIWITEIRLFYKAFHIFRCLIVVYKTFSS